MTDQHTPREHITALILAGGAGRRAGGVDKGLILYNGSPLVKHVIDRIAPQVQAIIISCNRNASDYARYSKLTAPDLRAGYLGPLAGIESALPLLETEYVLLCPCDTPNLPPDLVQRLAHARDGSHEPAAACIANDGKRDHYLNALVKRDALYTVVDELNRGQYAVRHWLFQMDLARADFSDCPEAFENINRL